MQQHLVLVDGHHLMYRAYYAIPKNLKASNGELMNAVYGVASMLLSLLRLEQPDALLFCFDEGEDTFRHKENATYKDGRQETPDEFYSQIPRIMELIDAFHITRESNPGFEADDLLCSYAKAGEAAGMRVSIVTGDRDAFQLVTENIRVAIPHKGYQQPEYLGPKEVQAKWGIRPDQVASFKGLCGDASDNLPGVKGIGPKGAAELLQKYDTLEGIYAHLSELKPGTRSKLEANKEAAFFCERMAQLVCIPLKHPLESLVIKNIDIEPARQFLRSVQMMTLLSRLESIAKSPYGQGRFISSTPVQAKPVEKQADQLTLF